MGFWSSIGGAISSAVSAVGSAFSSACSAVGNACSAVGRAVSSAFTGVMENIGTIAQVVSAVAPVLQALSVVMPQLRVATGVVTALDALFQAFGLSKNGETIEDIGEMVLDGYEADIKPTDFSTYDEYMQAIRAFKLENPNSSKEYHFSEKFTAGLTVQSWGLEEKFGEGSTDLVVSILKDAPNVAKGEGYFTDVRINNIISAVSSLADVAKYFAGKLEIDDKNKVEQELVKAEQQLNPDKSVDIIYQELDKYRKDD